MPPALIRIPLVCAKRQWPTRSAATEHMIAGKKAGVYEAGHRVYYCEGCKSYHVGRLRKRKAYGGHRPKTPLIEEEEGLYCTS